MYTAFFISISWFCTDFTRQIWQSSYFYSSISSLHSNYVSFIFFVRSFFHLYHDAPISNGYRIRIKFIFKTWGLIEKKTLLLHLKTAKSCLGVVQQTVSSGIIKKDQTFAFILENRLWRFDNYCANCSIFIYFPLMRTKIIRFIFT